MVERQIASQGIRDDRVLSAMREVPRERFVGEDVVEFAYRDSALPIEADQTISQPYVVAVTVEALGLEPDHRVLEVGAGSGYAAAVLSRIAARIFGIERHEILAETAQRALGRPGQGRRPDHQGCLQYRTKAPSEGEGPPAGRVEAARPPSPRACHPTAYGSHGGPLRVFLKSRDGRQIYFQEPALVDLAYDELEVGSEVRYAAAEGDEGPQASTVARLDPGKIGPTQERSIPLRENPRG